MNADLGTLSLAALTIGFLHTLFGPDHYVPFVAMSRVGRWSLPRTMVITLLCGIGHVGSSVVLGAVGIAFGVVVLKLETIEAVRGDLAGWLLIAFGLVYFSWGTVRAIRNRPHTHPHAHADGTVHTHEHTHQGEHLHPHVAGVAADNSSQSPSAKDAAMVSPATMTPWILFTIFLFGPCEPLIPMLMYPAAQGDVWGVLLVSGLFSLATLATMTTMVVVMCLGLGAVRMQRLQRFGHAAAGLVVLACGAAIKLGL